jgi:hypothetical protein
MQSFNLIHQRIVFLLEGEVLCFLSLEKLAFLLEPLDAGLERTKFRLEKVVFLLKVGYLPLKMRDLSFKLLLSPISGRIIDRMARSNPFIPFLILSGEKLILSMLMII